MATYGRGQMLGAGINPESFKQDFSGFADAAAIQAQGLSNFGQTISNTIQNVSEIKKENKKIDAMNKAAAKSIEAAITLGNSYGIAGANETLSPFLAAANDPNLSAIEKAALLSEAKNMIPSVFGRFDKSQEMQLQQAQLAGRGSGSTRPSNLKLDTIKEIINGQTYEVPVTFDPTDGTTRRLDGSIVGSVPVAASIDEAANLPSPTSLDSAAAANMQPMTGLPQGGMDAEAPSVLPPIYTDDTSQLPPLQEIQPVPVGAKPEDINAALSISQPSIPPGAVPITEKSEGQMMTQEEVGKLIQQGFKISGRPAAGGKVFVTDIQNLAPQKGQEVRYNPDGTVTITDIAVGNKAKAAEEYKVGNATTLMQELNLLEDTTKDMVPGVAGSAARMVGEVIPGTELAQRKEIIDRVKSTLTLGALQAMRNSSPTGGSLGNISNKDTQLLKDAATALDNAQSPEAFQRELVRLQNLQHNIIFGSEDTLREKLKKGDITQEQFNQSMSMAPPKFINQRGQVEERTSAQSQGSGGAGLSPEAQSVREELRRMREEMNKQ